MSGRRTRRFSPLAFRCSQIAVLQKWPAVHCRLNYSRFRERRNHAPRVGAQVSFTEVGKRRASFAYLKTSAGYQIERLGNNVVV